MSCPYDEVRAACLTGYLEEVEVIEAVADAALDLGQEHLAFHIELFQAWALRSQL